MRAFVSSKVERYTCAEPGCDETSDAVYCAAHQDGKRARLERRLANIDTKAGAEFKALIARSSRLHTGGGMVARDEFAKAAIAFVHRLEGRQ